MKFSCPICHLIYEKQNHYCPVMKEDISISKNFRRIIVREDK
jgi:RNA polymerase subunit RPABC4/transcription elongation factor Spt4